MVALMFISLFLKGKFNLVRLNHPYKYTSSQKEGSVCPFIFSLRFVIQNLGSRPLFVPVTIH